MTENKFLYEIKRPFITATEQAFLKVIYDKLPEGYTVQPQVNLASVIQRTDNFKYQNELYRNIDACIFDSNYNPVTLIEINDESHNSPQRKSRDYKVKCICEEAGLPLITFWTSYGINPDYIGNKINQGIFQSQNPERICHSGNLKTSDVPHPNEPLYENKKYSKSHKKGCYIATCVYGTYDCPELWILRRYRDIHLSSTWHGKLFIKSYYYISPILVKLFGKSKWFKSFCGKLIRIKIKKLIYQGYDSTPYDDILN